MLPSFIVLETAQLKDRRTRLSLVDKKHNCELDYIIFAIPSNLTAKTAIERYWDKQVQAYYLGLIKDLL